VTLNVAIMAHPRRKHAAKRLAAATGAQIVWDERDDEWHTGARAIAAYDPTATHHLVLQDDALPIDDFLEHAAAALEHRPDDLVSFYLGTSRPPQWQAAVDDACMRAEDAGAAWITAPALLHGVAIAIPTTAIPQMLAWCQPLTVPYDQRIGMYWRRVLEQRVLYTWPSLVDHDDTRSLVQHPDGAPRTAIRRARLLGTPERWDTDAIDADRHLP
jgi:hypothetical protein